MDASAYPDWSYDGSSTAQAEGNNSDCIIRRVCFVASLCLLLNFGEYPVCVLLANLLLAIWGMGWNKP